MHIQIDLRGYRGEQELIKEARRLLNNLLQNDMQVALLDIIGYNNVEEADEFVAVGWNEHIYPNEKNEYPYWGCLPANYDEENE